jgi:hypothetical protein
MSAFDEIQQEHPSRELAITISVRPDETIDALAVAQRELSSLGVPAELRPGGMLRLVVDPDRRLPTEIGLRRLDARGIRGEIVEATGDEAPVAYTSVSTAQGVTAVPWGLPRPGRVRLRLRGRQW